MAGQKNIIGLGWIRHCGNIARQCDLAGSGQDCTKVGIDFTAALGHKPTRNMHVIGGASIMDTSDFDKQAHSHLNIYNSFMNGAKIVGGFVVLTLVVMAATLL